MKRKDRIHRKLIRLARTRNQYEEDVDKISEKIHYTQSLKTQCLTDFKYKRNIKYLNIYNFDIEYFQEEERKVNKKLNKINKKIKKYRKKGKI